MSPLVQISELLKAFFGSLQFVVKHKLYAYFLPAIILAILFYLSVLGGSSIAERIEFMGRVADHWANY